jgi:phosphatidylserine/phosphatidylglycerophosphate/cardiolipin synthase-like enzyme
MRRVPWLPALGLTFLVSIGCEKNLPPVAASAPASNGRSVEVHFSPGGGCTEAIVHELSQASTRVRIQAYSFTSAPIAKAIIEARKRGVAVEALLDKSNRTDKYSAGTFLKNEGCDVRIDAKHAIAHNKIIIIDDRTILTGSFNFTRNAEENNAENLLVIRDDVDLARKYVANFLEHQKHSEVYTGPEAAKKPAARRDAESNR